MPNTAVPRSTVMTDCFRRKIAITGPDCAETCTKVADAALTTETTTLRRSPPKVSICPRLLHDIRRYAEDGSYPSPPPAFSSRLHDWHSKQRSLGSNRTVEDTFCGSGGRRHHAQCAPSTQRVEELDTAADSLLKEERRRGRSRTAAGIPTECYSGAPEEFGAIAVFLASEPHSYVTRSKIRVNGGGNPPAETPFL
jgi:hypothetical protein